MEIDRSTYEENENIQHWDKIKMSSMGDLLNRKPKEKKRVYSKEGELATEIYEYFNKKLSYLRIMSFIKNNGFQCVFEIFKETKDKGVGLFIWVNNKERTKFK
jgi:hypothetical protein